MKTLAEIEQHRAELLCEALLKSKLIPSDSHDESTSWMTEDGTFYFSPCEGEFVMSEVTLTNPVPTPTDKPRWMIETVKVIPSHSYWEPDDSDIVEIGDRQNSLWGAIKEAARQLANWAIDGTAENIYWETDKFGLEPESY